MPSDLIQSHAFGGVDAVSIRARHLNAERQACADAAPDPVFVSIRARHLNAERPQQPVR